MLLLEIAFFHDFGDFGQLPLTACWSPVKFEIGNLERVIWTPFLPNIMVRNIIFASGGQKKLFFCTQACCWNNHLQMLNLNILEGLRKCSVNLSVLYYVKELCLNFLNLKNYIHITKIESCSLYQSALTIFSQKVLGHLDFGMPGSWIWHQKSVFKCSVYWKIASKRCNAAIEMIFCSS